MREGALSCAAPARAHRPSKARKLSPPPSCAAATPPPPRPCACARSARLSSLLAAFTRSVACATVSRRMAGRAGRGELAGEPQGDTGGVESAPLAAAGRAGCCGAEVAGTFAVVAEARGGWPLAGSDRWRAARDAAIAVSGETCMVSGCGVGQLPKSGEASGLRPESSPAQAPAGDRCGVAPAEGEPTADQPCCRLLILGRGGGGALSCISVACGAEFAPTLGSLISIAACSSCITSVAAESKRGRPDPSS